MIYSLEEFEKFDKMKSKVIKYVLYKKRTEQEIRQKFAKEFDENILDDIIEELKEDKYIDDYKYIERAVSEFINLKSLSLKEMKYKLYSKGVKSSLIDEYISNNIEELEEYELKSACKIVSKKKNSMKIEDIKLYLLKKGYREENVREAIESIR
ncbi:MAG: RecX family transcriptional regulator [Clostridia bacterium]|nr:RecX family transcriptional regulator [Clostridia bacterium]